MPEGETGIGVDADGVAVVGCTLLSVACAESLPGAGLPRSQPLASAVAASNPIASARIGAITQSGKGGARPRATGLPDQGKVKFAVGSVVVASTFWLCVVPFAFTTTV
jgi:hypothetical protein